MYRAAHHLPPPEEDDEDGGEDGGKELPSRNPDNFGGPGVMIAKRTSVAARQTVSRVSRVSVRTDSSTSGGMMLPGL